MTSWKQMLSLALEFNGETFDDLQANTLTEEEMLQEFDADYGSVNGKPFTAWSAKHVYFPVTYDGSEWVSSVSRNPDGIPTDHVGGW